MKKHISLQSFSSTVLLGESRLGRYGIQVIWAETLKKEFNIYMFSPTDTTTNIDSLVDFQTFSVISLYNLCELRNKILCANEKPDLYRFLRKK